jgi:hypothetical protein
MEELAEIRRELPISALHGSPVVGEKLEPMDRDSATLDISDMPSFKGANVSQLAFETGGGTTLQPPARSAMARTAAWIAGSLALLAVVALGFVWGFSGATAAPEQPPDPRAAEPADESSQGQSGPGHKISLKTSIHLTVQVDPPVAHVTVDGEFVPEDGIDLARGNDPVKVIVEAEGFQSRTLEVVPVSDIDLDLELDKLAEPVEESTETPKPETKGKKTPKPGKAGGKGAGKKPPGSEKQPEEKPPKKPPKKPDKDHSLDRPMDNPF